MRGWLAVSAIVGAFLVAKGEVRCEKGRVVARDVHGKTYLESGEHGLWLVKFAETNRLSAAQVEREDRMDGRFSETRHGDTDVSKWLSSILDVTVTTVHQSDGSLTMKAHLTAKKGIVEDFHFPANLRFRPADVARFVFPGRGNETTGMALNERFFTSKCSYSVPYPPLFADWARLETKSGASIQIYGVQRRGNFAPWKNPHPFVPGSATVAGDGRGGYYSHASAYWLKPGESVETPAVRIVEGGTVDSSLSAYLKENGLGRSLSSKLPPRDGAAFLRRLAASPLLLVLAADAKRITSLADDLPMPTLVHIHDYMPHGFDNAYPDFFPPRKTFGSPEDFRNMVVAIHARGGLFMPYTNPCWWGSEPFKSEVFKKAGMEPIARKRDGSPITLKYGRHRGYNITYWHPDVQAANRATRREARETYGSDILFQDQCGSLPWFRDFSPHSPSVTAHEEGMISIVEEDSRHMPLFTEDGFDMVADSELGLTGCAWGTVPLEDMVGRKLHKEKRFPADTWVLEPVAQRLFRDKLLFYHHDLAGFTRNERVLAWVLALGYNIVVAYRADELTKDEGVRRWYAWLHALQSRVLARTVGGRVTEFVHDRSPLFARGIDPATPSDDGTVVATYGGVRFLVNLGDVPRTIGGHRLAPYGWWIEGLGVKAGMPEDGVPFIEADGEKITYVR